MKPNEQKCEPFELLISAMIDGELPADQRSELDAHLEQCESCVGLLDDFQNVDCVVESIGFEHNPNANITETFVVTRQKPSMKNWLSVWRLVPLAGVAALMVGLFLVMTQPALKATAEQLTPEEFVRPLADLNRINIQQQRDQELMLRTLGMDLRALKLELNQLENAGPEDRLRLEKQIETMLDRVSSFEG